MRENKNVVLFDSKVDKDMNFQTTINNYNEKYDELKRVLDYSKNMNTMDMVSLLEPSLIVKLIV